MTKQTKQKVSASSTHIKSSAPKNKVKVKAKESKPEKPVAIDVPPVLEPEEDEEGEEENESSGDIVNDVEGGSDSEEGDSEDEGVDEEGMERLMKLLGEDGLDDFDRAQLEGLVGDYEGEAEEDSEDEAGEESEKVSDEEGNDESISDENLANGDKQDAEEYGDDDDAIPVDEVDEIDADQVPRQKLEIDNQVRILRLSHVMLTQTAFTCNIRSHLNAFAQPFNSTPHYLGLKRSQSHTLKKLKSMSMTTSTVSLLCTSPLVT